MENHANDQGYESIIKRRVTPWCLVLGTWIALTSTSAFHSFSRVNFNPSTRSSALLLPTMRPGSSVVALAVGLLPSVRAGAGAIPWLETCSVNAVLEYFTCQTPVPEGCIDNLAEQATAWCSSYLSIKAVTVHLSTETPVLTETVVETSTTISTSIEVV